MTSCINIWPIYPPMPAFSTRIYDMDPPCTSTSIFIFFRFTDTGLVLLGPGIGCLHRAKDCDARFTV